MKRKTVEHLPGRLDLPRRNAQALEPLHGLGVCRRIEPISKGTFQVEAGAWFPAIQRKEEAGGLESFWGESEHYHRVKFYQLTRAGQRQLKIETDDWQRISIAMVNVLQTS
jgi:PadR family transcriptional regulator, regulatory protein PadR